MASRLAPLLAAVRMHSGRTWLLWLVGVFAMGTLFSWDPALAVYLMDPEFVAAWLLFVVHYLRQGPRQAVAVTRRVIPDFIRWESRLLIDYVGLRLGRA